MKSDVKSKSRAHVVQIDDTTWAATHGKRMFKAHRTGVRVRGVVIYSTYQVLEGSVIVAAFSKRRKKNPVELIAFSIETICS